ncbi:MAG: hypothetical protein RR426_09175 [Oscillospiraceae bacterium]
MAYDDLLKIRTWSLGGKKTENITGLLQSKTWSGSARDCCRQLSFDVLTAGLCELGGLTRLYHGTEVLFSGHIRERTRDAALHTIGCVAYDHGLFLKTNSTYLQVRGRTPEDVTAALCGEFGIAVGALAATGVKLRRNFMGVTLYGIIQTLYTLAAEQTGKQYQIRFLGDRLHVVVREKTADTIRLLPGVNLLDCVAGESTTGMVTRVAVFDEQCRKKATYDSPEGFTALYGLMQTAIRADKREDPATTAKQLLADGGIQTTLTVSCLGNTKLITGNSVAVHEPVTGTDGLFWITSDRHSFQHGIYCTKLTLSFHNLMDRQEAGSLPTK